MKKIIALLLALTLVLAFAGCTKGGNASPGNAPTPAPTAAPTEAPAPTETPAPTEAPAAVMSHAEYIAAPLDSAVTVETYVQDKQSWWDDKANLYCQSEDGAYFIYETYCTEEDFAKLLPGTKIKVSGFKSEWSGEVEIIDGTFEILEGSYIAQPFDATALLGTDALADHMNELAAFTGLTVEPSTDADGNVKPWLYKWNGSGQDGDDLYLNVSVGGATYSFTVESYLRGAGSEVYEAVKQLQIGDTIDLTAFLYWYEGPNPHIVGVTKQAAEEGMSHADYIAADLDSPVTVVTYVQDKQSWWDDKANLYCQSPDGAYFIYETYCTEEDFAKLLPGTKIKVSGYKSEWSGQVEIIDGTFEILEGSYIAPAFDATALLGTDALIDHMNEFVTFKGVTVAPSTDADGNEAAFLYKWNGSGQDGDDLYFNVSVNGATYSFTVESYLRGAGTEVYEAVKQLQVGDVIDVTGFLYWYEGPNPHIISVAPAAPAEEGMSHADYIAADLDSAVTVVTYVQDKQSWWDDKANLYCQSPDGAYFIYETYCTEEDFAKLLPGTKIKVSGYKSEWSGQVEIIDGTFEILEGSYIAPAFDATALLGTDALIDHMNEFVTFKGVTVAPSTDADGNEAAFLYKWNGSGQDGDDLYFNVSVNGQTYSFTVESYLRGAGTEVYEAVKQLQIGDVIDVTGFLYWYEGPNPHIISVSPAA